MTVTTIEWASHTHGFTIGCSRQGVSCAGCYAMHDVHRKREPLLRLLVEQGKPLTKKTDRGVDWTSRVAVVAKRFTEPARWRKPRMSFVNSRSDPFHPSLPRWVTYSIAGSMVSGHAGHTWLVLTKHPARAANFCSWLRTTDPEGRSAQMREAMERPDPKGLVLQDGDREVLRRYHDPALWAAHLHEPDRVPRNIWWGTSVGNRDEARERMPRLGKLPAPGRRFVSLEPQLEEVPFELLAPGKISQIIQGGESGHGSHRFDGEWASSLRDAAHQHGVAHQLKQVGANPWWDGRPLSLTKPDGKRDAKGAHAPGWPAELRGHQEAPLWLRG